MKLNSIPKSGLWNGISDRLNENFSKINAEVESLGEATIKNCGYFSTLEALQHAYPRAGAGSKAYVGASYPYAIYLWNTASSAWVDSGATGGEENVNLEDYYTKENVDEKVAELESEFDTNIANQKNEIADFKEAITDQVENYKPIVINGDVTNAADEEDITCEDNLLKLKNRSALNGMGYVILRNNKTFAEQLSLTNTTYEIRYDFDLSENEVFIPQGCVLLFNGGCLVNGTLVGNHTIIQTDTKKIFENIKIKGSWDCPVIYSEWFANKTDVLKEVIALSQEDVYNHIVIGNGIYDVSCPSDSSRYSNRGALELNSNTHLTILGEVRMIPNALEFYNVIQLNNSQNIRIDGGGYIVGDINEHFDNNPEWGHGISIMAVKNVVIENITIKNCHGDGINVGITQQLDMENNVLYKIEMSKNVTIHNVVIDKCSRQGISVVHAENCSILNSAISNIQGKKPMAAIDIEPDKIGYVRNVVIDNIYAENCELGICVYSQDDDRNHLQNVSIRNCHFVAIRNTDLHLSQSQLTEITNCVFSDAINIVIDRYVKKCIISNCHFPQKDSGVSIYANPDGEDNEVTIQNCTFEKTEISSKSAKFISNTFNDVVQFNASVYLCDNIFNAKVNIYPSLIACTIDGNTFNDAPLYFRRGVGFMNNNIFNIVNPGDDYLCIAAAGKIIANNTIIDNRSLSEFYTYLTCTNTIYNGLVLTEHDGCSFPRNTILSSDSNIASYINGVVFQTYEDGRNLVDFSGKIFINPYNLGRAITTPTSGIVGQSCMIDGITQWWNGARWVDSYNQTPVKKASSQRPTLSASDKGISIYDTAINRPIWWNGNKWIDALGEDVE